MHQFSKSNQHFARADIGARGLSLGSCNGFVLWVFPGVRGTCLASPNEPASHLIQGVNATRREAPLLSNNFLRVSKLSLICKREIIFDFFTSLAQAVFNLSFTTVPLFTAMRTALLLSSVPTLPDVCLQLSENSNESGRLQPARC